MRKEALFTVFFADDQIVTAKDEDLTYMVRKLQEEYEAAGLIMNMPKCDRRQR